MRSAKHHDYYCVVGFGYGSPVDRKTYEVGLKEYFAISSEIFVNISQSKGGFTPYGFRLVRGLGLRLGYDVTNDGILYQNSIYGRIKGASLLVLCVGHFERNFRHSYKNLWGTSRRTFRGIKISFHSVVTDFIKTNSLSFPEISAKKHIKFPEFP